MMSVNEVISLMNKKFPTRYVNAIVSYKRNFLVCAPEKSIGEDDYSDPYFVVSSSNGSIEHFLPTNDISGFLEAVRGKVLYKK